MSDSIDHAQARDEFFRETALAEHFRRGNRNAMAHADVNCASCGNEIPDKRRQALPGCTHCISCQEQHEIHTHWRAL